MAQISTDRKKIEELVTRGVERIYPSADFLRSQLLSGRRLTVYLGLDPTSPTLHLGHVVPLRKLQQFQALGHRAVLLIGDFTALSGDPDKSEARTPLTRRQVLSNCRRYRAQAGRVLAFSGANKAECRFNSAWLSKLTFARVVDLASKETVQRMLARDLFQRRFAAGTPLYLHEFLYPLMQGYDSVVMDVDGEVGGNDQTFNMLTGRDLMKKYSNKEKFVLTTKLLADASGKKMGKTEGNMVALSDSANNAFGAIMSWTDEMIVPSFELLTDLPMDELKERLQSMRDQSLNPRDAKEELARRVVSSLYGAKRAEAAARRFIQTFRQKEAPQDIPAAAAPAGPVLIADFLVREKLVSSKSEARRLIEQGGVRVDQTKITDWKQRVSLTSGCVVRVGKRRFIRIY